MNTAHRLLMLAYRYRAETLLIIIAAFALAIPIANTIRVLTEPEVPVQPAYCMRSTDRPLQIPQGPDLPPIVISRPGPVGDCRPTRPCQFIVPCSLIDPLLTET